MTLDFRVADSVEADTLGWCIPIDVSSTASKGKKPKRVTLNEHMIVNDRSRGIGLGEWLKAFTIEFALRTFGIEAARTLAKTWQCEDSIHYIIYSTRVVVRGVGVSFNANWQDRETGHKKEPEPPVGWMRVSVNDVKLNPPILSSDAVVLPEELHVRAREITGRTVPGYTEGAELVYCFEPIIPGDAQAKESVFAKVQEQFAFVLNGEIRDLTGRSETLSREEIKELGTKTALWRQASRLFARSRNASPQAKQQLHARMQQLLAGGAQPAR
ncbi:hypothetical protein HY992_01695 [Candidatus Micrarchaeota archaeon]|nr:hypothetical protein [Candidatus Micrarchaeota archaeon]